MPHSKLPLFPDFTSLESHHQTHINNALRLIEPYSDYNFISLWSWDSQKKLQLSLLNDNLVVRFQDYINPENFFYSFLGAKRPDDTAQILLEHSVAEGSIALHLIPEFVVNELQRPKDFVIEEDRDSFDYIVAIKDMIKPRKESKRRDIKKFTEEHGNRTTIRELDISDTETAEQILQLLEKWKAQTAGNSTHNEHEWRAINKILEQHHEIKINNLHVLGIYLDDELKAFSINEIVGNGFAMGHYKKADRSYRGLESALDSLVAKRLAIKGVTHLNHEQDLGVEGLRRSKMAHHPVYFLKKYTLLLKKPL